MSHDLEKVWFPLITRIQNWRREDWQSHWCWRRHTNRVRTLLDQPSATKSAAYERRVMQKAILWKSPEASCQSWKQEKVNRKAPQEISRKWRFCCTFKDCPAILKRLPVVSGFQLCSQYRQSNPDYAHVWIIKHIRWERTQTRNVNKYADFETLVVYETPTKWGRAYIGRWEMCKWETQEAWNFLKAVTFGKLCCSLWQVLMFPCTWLNRC